MAEDDEGGKGPRVRNVVFTVNAVDGTEVGPMNERIRMLDFQHRTWADVKYCIYQYEVGAETGRLHMQGYLELSRQKTYKQLHEMEGLEHASFQKRHGSAKQAKHYCMKPVAGCDCNACTDEARAPTKVEGPWEFGEMSAQGQRADLLEVKKAIDNGTSLKRIAQDPELFPTWVKFPRAFHEYKHMVTPERTRKPQVWLFIGPSGTGKTRTAMALAKGLGSVYKVPPKQSGFWCDRYNQETVFVIDEMSGSKMTPEFFNELLDWYPMDVPCHGTAGHQFNSPYVFICTNYHPRWWWKKHSSADQLKQTMRRIDIIVKIGFKKRNPCHWCSQGLCFVHMGFAAVLNQVIDP